MQKSGLGNKTKNRLKKSVFLYVINDYFFFFLLFTDSSNSEPGLNFTTFLAAILIVFPVCGFLPSRAALSLTDHEPNPTKETLSPFFKDPETFPKNDSSANLAAAFVIPASAAIASINCVLFIIFLFRLIN